jgi:hypothetical protein
MNEAVDIALINDINCDGVFDLAVLLRIPGRAARARMQCGRDGAFSGSRPAGLIFRGPD